MTGGADAEPARQSATADDEAIPETVVVPLDGSDFALRAVPIASAFALRFDAELILMTTPLARDPLGRTEKPAWLREAAARSGSQRVRTVLAHDDDAGSAIAAVVGGLPDAVVCMTTRGRGRIAAAALGSVAQQVVHRLARPVVLVGPDCAEEWQVGGSMIVCHDGSLGADAILAPARAWAQFLSLPILIVHVFHPLDAERERAPAADIARAIEYLEPEGGVRVLPSSYPAGTINTLIEELNPSLVAMSTHGRTGLARIVLGSVATAVIHKSACPILVTRPRNLDVEPTEAGDRQ